MDIYNIDYKVTYNQNDIADIKRHLKALKIKVSGSMEECSKRLSDALEFLEKIKKENKK